MHAPRLKKWAAIVDHRDFFRHRACNPQLNHAADHARSTAFGMKIDLFNNAMKNGALLSRAAPFDTS
jgi:hypothetical protein